MTEKNKIKKLDENDNVDEKVLHFVNMKVPQELYLHVNRCPSVTIRRLDITSVNRDRSGPCFLEVFKDINDFNTRNRPVFHDTGKIVPKDETMKSEDIKKPTKKKPSRKNRRQKVIEEDKSDENIRVPQLCKLAFIYVCEKEGRLVVRIWNYTTLYLIVF